MKLIPTKVTQTFGKTVLKAKKQSPHIFFAGGVVGVVGSTFLACRATLKLEPTLDIIDHDIQETKRLSENDSKALMLAYSRAGVHLSKLYWPSLALGALSIGALTGSHIQLTRRNTALTAAYAGLSQFFDQYRERVQEVVGEEKERDIYLDAKEVTIEEDGKKKKVSMIGGLPPNSFYFNKHTTQQWEPDPQYNRYFLQIQQNYWNERLNAKGHVFLMEILDTLGLERTKDSSIIGWVINDGAGCIDFGVTEQTDTTRFANNVDWGVILTFNVDGIMYDKI